MRMTIDASTFTVDNTRMNPLVGVNIFPGTHRNFPFRSNCGNPKHARLEYSNDLIEL